MCSVRVASLLLVALLAACESRVSLGERCSSSSDCRVDVCGVGGVCRAQCTTSAQCGGGRCLRDPVTGVAGCSLVTDECSAGSCADGLRCVDGACLGVCVRALDCPDGVCVDDVCVVGEPSPDASVDASADASAAMLDAPDAAAVEACPAGGVRDLDVGRLAVCAVRCDDRVFCWGGWGLATSRLSPSPEDCAGSACLTRPVEIALPAGRSWLEVAVGHQRACALSSEGEVWCWGSIIDTPIDAPVRILLEEGGVLVASEIRAGGSHTCARERGAPTSVRCWGWNENGQLGNGTRTHSESATIPFTGVDRLAPGEWRTQVLESDGSVRGVGVDDDAEIAWPPSVDELVLVERLGLSVTAVDVAALSDQTCVLGGAGELECWGRVATLFGRTEPSSAADCGANRCVSTPVTLARGRIPDGPLAGIAGDRFGRELFVWDAAGTVYGVGAGASVIGPEAEYFEPVLVSPLAGMRTHHVRVGAGTACAILDGDRTVVCWGGNDVGQLGRGTHGAPTTMPAPPSW
jgi:hypothetical protein